MSGGHRPGEVYDTVCTVANPSVATCEGDGLTATAENSGGYFTVGTRYVWSVSPAPHGDSVGEDSAAPQSGG